MAPAELLLLRRRTRWLPASPERTPGTYSKYNSIDDRIDDFHYYTTFMKFGIGRATYDAAQEIRSGDITREEGVALVNRFDGEFPERFAEEIFAYLSISREGVSGGKQDVRAADDGPAIFHASRRPFPLAASLGVEDGEWKLRHTAWEHSPVGKDYVK